MILEPESDGSRGDSELYRHVKIRGIPRSQSLSPVALCSYKRCRVIKTKKMFFLQMSLMKLQECWDSRLSQHGWSLCDRDKPIIS